MRKILVASSGVIAALIMTACGGSQEEPPHPTASASSTPSSPPTPSSVPLPDPTYQGRTFSLKNYDYTYDVKCNCPSRGLITAEVRNGELTKAIAANGDDVTSKGGFDLLTIAEMLRVGNEAVEGTKTTVDWPATQDYPNSINLDADPNTTDNEVTYSIHSFKKIN